MYSSIFLFLNLYNRKSHVLKFICSFAFFELNSAIKSVHSNY